jgi:hypothetical protein
MPELKEQGQEDGKFEANLGYIATHCLKKIKEKKYNSGPFKFFLIIIFSLTLLSGLYFFLEKFYIYKKNPNKTRWYREFLCTPLPSFLYQNLTLV